MDKKMFRSLLLLVTYAIVLVAVIVKLDTITGWLVGVLDSFQPIFIGAAIAFVLNGPCGFFARLYEKRLPARIKRTARPLAVATTYFIVAVAIALLIALVVPELVHSIEMFIGNLGTYAANLQELFDWAVDKLDLEQLANLDLSSGLSGTLRELLTRALDALTNTLPHLISMTSVLISVFVTWSLALMFSIYMLSGAPSLIAQFRRLAQAYLPRRVSDDLLSVARLTADTFTKYVNGQVVEAFILGALCFTGMCVFRFDYAPLISVAIGVTALIPIAGAYLGSILAFLLLVMIDPWQAVWFQIFLSALQQFENNIIYPRVVGTSMGLPGIWVLAAVTVGGSMMGLLGMIISVPVAAVAYILLRQNLRARLAAKEAGEEKTPPQA